MTGIIIAFPKADMGNKIKSILVRSGFRVSGVCTNGAQTIQEANELQYGVLVCSYRLPDMIYRELKEYLPAGFQMVAITSREDWAENGDSDVVSLSQPLKVHELVSTVEMVAYSVERTKRKMRQQPRKRTGEEQDLIDRAKGILMNRNNMTEEEAHRYLQKTSMDNGTSFTETAQMILSMMDM
ncbi:MAG: ANTAR domain-containing protein [Lachnospiraceae bacterium]|nr:ANTAR domain-containing protein [Lachnospiraceae bacterium]